MYKILLSCGLLLSIGLNGCRSEISDRKDKYIDDMVVGFAKQRKAFLEQANGVYEDARAYRDGKEDVVVFERKLSKDHSDLVLPDLKSKLISDLQEHKATCEALRAGIQIRFVDKTGEGVVVSDILLTAEDL